MSPGDGETGTRGRGEDDDWVVDLELSLVKAFGWSLRDIDETDIDSLLPFIARASNMQGRKTVKRQPGRVYCDEVSWL